MVSERDPAGPPSDRPDALQDFPEEFAQRPDGPPRDLARRGRETAPREDEAEPEPGSARARIDAMKRRMEELAKR